MISEHSDAITDITLLSFTAQHVDRTFQWVKNPELRRLFLMRGELDLDSHMAYFSRVLNDDRQIWYALIFQGEHIGNCGLKNLDLKKKECELWIYIGEQAIRGKGIGRKATVMLIERSKEIGCHHIYLHVADFNNVAIKMYSSLGFCRSIDQGDLSAWKKRGIRVIRMELAQ